MSAHRAAVGLLEFDVYLCDFVGSLPAERSVERKCKVIEFVRESVCNTLTLSLAAYAAGVTEQEVIAALLFAEPLRIGPRRECADAAAELFGV